MRQIRIELMNREFHYINTDISFKDVIDNICHNGIYITETNWYSPTAIKRVSIES